MRTGHMRARKVPPWAVVRKPMAQTSKARMRGTKKYTIDYSRVDREGFHFSSTRQLETCCSCPPPPPPALRRIEATNMDSCGDDDDGTCEAIIPGLPDDLALRCLAKISHGYHGLLECVSKKWKRAIRSMDYAHIKAREGWCGDWLFVLGADSPALWHAYDPDADRWHPLPTMPGFTDDDELCRFSCVSVSNKFLVIGGCHISHSEKRCWETRSVMVFDPFKKQWNAAANMQTARTDFACAVISDKVYVAGGSNSSSSEGLATAEIYDPDADKWKDLPSMPFPLIECFSISHGGQFHVVGKRICNFQHDTYVTFNPSEQKWHVMEDLLPVCKLTHDTTTIIESDIYSILPDGTVTMVMPDQRDWHALGVYPAVVLPDHDRPLSPFGFGFIAFGRCIYVVGGMVLKYNTSNHTYAYVKLDATKFCDPRTSPLEWQDAKPMPVQACRILGCASMEE